MNAENGSKGGELSPPFCVYLRNLKLSFQPLKQKGRVGLYGNFQ